MFNAMEATTAYWRENPAEISLCSNILVSAPRKKKAHSSRQWFEYMLPWSGILPIKTAKRFLTVLTAIRPSGFTLSQTSSPKTKHGVQVRSYSEYILLLKSAGHCRNPDTMA